VRKGAVSWETIRYMVAEIQYGGRITDNKDRELFATITRVLYDKEICTSNFAFCSTAAYRYGIPMFDEIQKHRDFVRETYPEVDAPDVFGMSPNADITYRSRQAQDTLGTILDIQPRSAGTGSGQTREEKVLTITDSYLKLMPDKWNPDKKERLGDRQPLSIFAGQEIDRLMITIRVIRSTCTDLRLAVAGTIIMSPKLQDALNFIYDGRVPPAWVAVSWPSPSVATWIGEVQRRFEQLDSWARTGRPQYYWFSGFFNPQGFLTSVRQEITRSHVAGTVASSWALDRVETRTEVRTFDYRTGQMEGKEEPLPEPKAVSVYGLSLDGCSWNRNARKLQEAAPGELFKELPVLVISAGLIGEKREDGGGKRDKSKQPTLYYHCPVYKYPVRTDNQWIFDVDLPCDEGDTHWRLRGVALLCTTE